MKKIQHLIIILFTMSFGQVVNAQESNSLLHVADEASIYAYYTQVDHEHMNKKVFLYPLITHNFNPGGGAGVYNTKPVTIGKNNDYWRIFNDDKSTFTKNTDWNIFIPGADFNSWAHFTTVENIVSNYTIIDHPDLNGNPDALLFVTKLYSKDGGAGKLNDHTIGVFYVTLMKKWAIFNQNKDAMETGLAFSVVFEDKTEHTTFLHTANAENTSNQITIIDNPACNGNPNARVIVTQNWNHGSAQGVYNNHEVGVFYNGKNWTIYNEDKSAMPEGAAFNVLVVKEEVASNSNNDLMNIPSLRIAPNPVNSGEPVQIDLYNATSEALHLEVMDMAGRSVIHDNIEANGNVVIHRLSTDGLKPGMYMIKVYNARIAAVRRLVIN